MAGVFLGLKSLKAQASCVKIILLLTFGSTLTVASIETKWWENPCSSQTTKRSTRHSRNAAVTQLGTLRHLVDYQIFGPNGRLKAVYPEAYELYYNNTHPKSCPNISKLIKQMRNASKKIAHRKFPQAMVSAYEYLDKLQNIHISTETKFNNTLRHDIYQDTKHYLKLFVCELRQDPYYKKVKWNNLFKKNPPNINVKCLPPKLDFTYLGSMDVQFFVKLRRFLHEGKKTLRRWRTKSKKKGKVSEQIRTKDNRVRNSVK